MQDEPRRRNHSASTGPVRLGDLIRDGKLLWAYCRDCGRERDLDPATLPLPKDFPVPEVGNRMICSVCQSRKVATAPELYPGGIMAMREGSRKLARRGAVEE